MKTLWPSLLLLLLAISSSSSRVSYEGYQVIKIWPRTQEEAQWVATIAKEGVDVWRWSKVEGLMEVLVPDGVDLLGPLQGRGVPAEVSIQDVQRLIERQTADSKLQRPSPLFDHTAYHDLHYIYGLLDILEADSELISTYTAGVTLEGRDIRVVEVSSGGAGSRPVVWIDCGIHAREWITHATCQWILDKLIVGYGSNPGITDLLDTYDFHIMPVVNPDGYAFTWNEDRLWRKNRHPYNESEECVGVDLNRNFDYHFGGLGSSNAHCLSIYRGEFAFSELESQAIAYSLTALSGRLKAYFALHSYFQMWMTPWGYTFQKPQDYDEQLRVAEVGAAALMAVHGTNYSVGNLASTIYPSAGMSGDWVYGSLGMIYSYVLELPDKDTFHFLLPPEYIIPVGEETWTGLQAAINAIPRDTNSQQGQ